MFCSNDLQNLVDVSLGNLVAGVWHGGMALALANESLTFLSLGWYLNDLVIDHTVRQGYCREERQQIRAHRVAVDGLGLHRMNDIRQVYHVDVNELEAFYHLITHLQTVIGTLQICHTEGAFLKVKGHKAMEVFVYLLPA